MDKKFTKALNFAYFYLKYRPRTRKEIYKYLIKKSKRFKYTEETIKQVIEFLINDDLINDKKFVSWFVDQRNRNKPKGEFALRNELLRLGIEKELIDDFFIENPLNEKQLAYKAVSSRWPLFKKLPRRKRLERTFQYLQRRGFNFDVIKKTYQRLEKKENVFEDFI